MEKSRWFIEGVTFSSLIRTSGKASVNQPSSQIFLNFLYFWNITTIATIVQCRSPGFIVRGINERRNTHPSLCLNCSRASSEHQAEKGFALLAPSHNRKEEQIYSCSAQCSLTLLTTHLIKQPGVDVVMITISSCDCISSDETWNSPQSFLVTHCQHKQLIEPG